MQCSPSLYFTLFTKKIIHDKINCSPSINQLQIINIKISVTRKQIQKFVQFCTYCTKFLHICSS